MEISNEVHKEQQSMSLSQSVAHDIKGTRRPRFLIKLKRVIRFCIGLYFTIASFLRAFVEVGWDVVTHWFSTGMDNFAPTFLKRQHILREMQRATTYREWRKRALDLDKMEGNQVRVHCIFGSAFLSHSQTREKEKEQEVVIYILIWNSPGDSEDHNEGYGERGVEREKEMNCIFIFIYLFIFLMEFLFYIFFIYFIFSLSLSILWIQISPFFASFWSSMPYHFPSV